MCLFMHVHVCTFMNACFELISTGGSSAGDGRGARVRTAAAKPGPPSCVCVRVSMRVCACLRVHMCMNACL